MASSTGQLRLSSSAGQLRVTGSPQKKPATNRQSVFDTQPILDSNPGTLGKAESTVKSQQSGIRWFNAVLQSCGFPKLHELKEVDVENDHMSFLLWKVGMHGANRLTPADFKDDLSPPNPDSTKALEISSIITYFGIGKNFLRERFPDHPLWPKSKSDNPECYQEITRLMKTQFERNKLLHWSDGNVTFGNSKIMPVYRYGFPRDDPDDTQDMKCWYGDDNHGNGCFVLTPLGCDLATIMARNFVECDPSFPEMFRNIARDQWTHNAINRGGEIKFVLWPEVQFHCYYHAFSHGAHQQKTLNGNCQAMVVNPNNPLLCPLFNMGLLMFPGQGLRDAHSGLHVFR